MVNEIQATTGQVVAAFGGAAVVIAALSAFLARIVSTRIAQSEKALIDEKIERLKGEVKALSEERIDALTRKRDLYSKLATSMRIFVQSDPPPGLKEKKEFLTAYDQTCLWGSESVVAQIGNFLDIMMRLSRDGAPESMRQMKESYAACILEMRKDSGFPDSQFEVRFITFTR